jgi:hypothetical protein
MFAQAYSFRDLLIKSGAPRWSSSGNRVMWNDSRSGQ